MADNISFLSAEHKARFVEIMRRLGKIYDGHKYDHAYASAFYVLTSDFLWTIAQKYITPHGIDLPTMLEMGHFSSGESIMLQWAGNLFNEQLDINPIELTRLDERNFNLALTALKIRYYGLKVEG